MTPTESVPDGRESNLGRPYRSHKVPACDFCHRRKSRCRRDRLDKPCSLCQLHRNNCTTSSTSHTQRCRPKPKQRQSIRISQGPSPGSPVAASEVYSEGDFQDAAASGSTSSRTAMAPTRGETALSSHIVGPAVAHDAQILGHYISPRDTGTGAAVSHVHPNPYSVYSDDPRNPVVYLKVPRQRSTASSGNGTSGFEQCEILENILGSLGPHLFELCV